MKKEQLGQLIIASEDTLYHVAKTLLYNDADCADAIQEAIVKAFTNIHTLRVDSHAKTWLVRILINECYAIMRREKRIVSLEDYQCEETAAEQEDYSDLYEAVRRLPQEIRICVTLYYLEGYSVKETAKLLEITESAVKNRLARARAKMRLDLEQAVT
ncbi:MAG: sigma-70 family RNA polymerase sigma factor [Lachnospiraceae bacterium]|jgi:RNA polymerase sigma factor, sigma-70 family|nr:sigma-70 family RNA polymerase sigma factor [Lachnospiraceae bacterium]